MGLGSAGSAIWEHWIVRLALAVLTAGYSVFEFAQGNPGVGRVFLAGAAMMISITVIGAEFYRTHTLEQELEPKLELVFDPPSNKLYDSQHLNGSLRKMRVGIINRGAEPATNVAVLLSRILPDVAGIFPMKTLQQTHQEDGVCRFTVYRSDEPQVFIEVIHQAIRLTSEPRGATMQLSVDFSDGRRTLPVTTDQYLLWLVIDGESAGKPLKLVLRRNPKTRQYDMERAFS
jgi:hypothetical protein